jgi:pyruvate-ferredoxin/flavodoxin oxidoreductase
MTSGSVQNQDAYMQAVAGQRPYFFEHISEITEQVMDEYASLTGRQYSRVGEYKMEDAEYVILGQGSMITQAQAVADYLRETRKLKVGVANLTIYRPFPGDMIGKVLKGRKGVVVLERTDQPLAEDLPLIREIRAAISKCIENGAVEGEKPYPTYANYKGKDIPALYSGSYGLGSRDLQPEGLIGAIENMLDDGKKKKFFYLGVDFVREAANPTAEIRQQELLDSYPHIAEMAVRGSENPDLLPEGAITMRMHSVGGWGAITTGKNLAMTLYDLLGYDIRANPKYGSEKKGQPTTYYLSAAPERIRLNCEYHFVDVVLSPDPNVFGHSNPLYGLKDGGFFIIQSNLSDADAVWQQIPLFYQKYINEHNIRVYFVDGFKIAKEEASNPDLQFRMQGNAFQGAFFAASPLMERANLTEEELFKSIEAQLQSKFGGKGANVVADNLRVVRRGFDEIVEITNKEISSGATQIKKETKLPIMLKQMPKGDEMRSDIHHFWEQTGSFYLSGQGNENLVDPLIATSLIPAATGVYRDMTQIRFEYPKFITENCTACGDCYTTCPDSAIPGLVNSVSDVFATAIERIETKGTLTSHLRRETRTVEKKLRALIETQGEQAVVSQLLDQAVLETLSESEFEGTKKEKLEKEFALFLDSIGGFEFSITKPYYSNKEKKQKGTGGLFSITINPYTCKGCMECVQVCDDGALVAETQTQDSIDTLRKDWAFWLDLPTTKEEYIRIDDLEEKIGALETLLLDKKNYNSLISGDGACLGCGEKTAIHIFTGTVTALMQPRVKKHISELDDLINRMETHIRLKLASSMDLSDTSAINSVVAENEDNDLTLSALSEQLSDPTVDEPVDQKWLKWATQLLEKLRHLKWLYTDGKNHVGRAEMGIVNATGCTSVWGSTFPFSPYPFPWTSHLFQDSPSVAMGLFEGHMSKMAEGFKAVRMAKLELEGKYDEVEHGSFFTYFDWKKFSDEEWQLCPPVTAVGGDGAMYDIGFQNLSRALASGMPIKVLILDTQVYSNTGGQSCTSGFIGQVADMAPYGKVMKGKTEIRKEMGIIGMAHRTSYILQSSQANVTHMIEGFIDGLNSRRPAMFNLYTTCQPEHGVADDATDMQTKMALESRAYPMFKYDPDEGTTFKECCDIEGNPSIDQDWVTYDLTYTDENGKEAKMTLPFTFADWALTEGRFRKQFSKAPQAAWNDDMVPLHEFLDMEEDDREGLFPYIWAVDNKNQLMRVLVAQEIVLSCEERRDFWHQLRSLAGEDPADQVDAAAIANQAKAEMAQSVASSLLSLAGGDPSALGDMAAAPAGGNGAATSTATAADFEPVWIETPECTACDECVEIAPQTFQYNDDKLAVVINPSANSYKEIVKAAEKCTAECIHPGTPWNMSEKDIEKLTKRAEKYQ